MKEKCTENQWPICKSESNKVDVVCNSNNVGYRWICTTCQNRNKVKVYEGETSRSARLRGKEHLNQYKGEKEDSVLYKHKVLEHSNEEVEFKMEITGVFRDALSRQAEESVRIQARKGSELMNSKSQFNHPPIARVVVEKKSRNICNGLRAKLSPGLWQTMKFRSGSEDKITCQQWWPKFRTISSDQVIYHESTML